MRANQLFKILVYVLIPDSLTQRDKTPYLTVCCVFILFCILDGTDLTSNRSQEQPNCLLQ